MAVALDNSGKLSGVAFAAGPFTLSYTTSGSNLVMIVSVGWDPSSANISAITYNGVSLGASLWDITEPTFGLRAVAYLLIAPASGANTFSLTFDAAVTEYGVSISTWTGVDQVTPNRTVSASGSDAGVGSVSVTAANAVSGDIIVDGIWGLNAALTKNAAQTLLQLSDNIGGNSRSQGSSYKTASGPSDTMAWSWATGGHWIEGIIPLVAAGGGAPSQIPYAPIFPAFFAQ